MMPLWNGNRGVISLTFDDGLRCQRDFAVPAMNEAGIPGTFFLIENSPYDKQMDVPFWREAVKAGHEVGSHGVNHRKAGNLTCADGDYEAKESKRFLENHLGVEITSFCYPFTDAFPVIQDPVRKYYKQARGGRVARWDKYIEGAAGINFYNIPSFHINEGTFDHGVANALVDAALERNAWVTFMFHAVNDTSGWDNVTLPTFVKFLDFLDQRRKHKGLWVAPFGTAAQSLRENK